MDSGPELTEAKCEVESGTFGEVGAGFGERHC